MNTPTFTPRSSVDNADGTQMSRQNLERIERNIGYIKINGNDVFVGPPTDTKDYTTGTSAHPSSAGVGQDAFNDLKTSFAAARDAMSERMKGFATGAGITPPDHDGSAVGEQVAKVAQIQRIAVFTGAISASTDSIIGLAKVCQDPESSGADKASATLKMIGSVAQFLALAGPEGVAAGALISCLLGVISSILDATSPPRKSMMQQLESLMRELQGDSAANELAAAHSLLNRQQAAIGEFDKASKTWEEMMATSPLTSGISQFKVEVALEWLRKPKNQESEVWEVVFVAFAESLVEIFSLYVKIKTKLIPTHTKVLDAMTKQVGAHIETLLVELLPKVSRSADCWHVGKKEYGYKTRELAQATRWTDINIGSVRAIAVGSANERALDGEREQRPVDGKGG